MKKSRKANILISLAFVFAAGGAFAQELAVPEVFESVPVSATAFEFARQCMPNTSESSFNRMVSDAGDRATTSARPSDKTQPYMVVARGHVYCIRMSNRKYPLLPLAAFSETIDFPEMSKDETARLKTDLSRQIARNGFATALVVNEMGHANQLVYLLASEQPIKFYYHNNFMKKGEFVESAFPQIYTTRGGITMTGRGQPADQVKFFFAR